MGLIFEYILIGYIHDVWLVDNGSHPQESKRDIEQMVSFYTTPISMFIYWWKKFESMYPKNFVPS